MKELMESYFDRLWPLCRSITGAGYLESLDILRELVPLEWMYFKSGEEVHDWVIPKVWQIRGGYIITPHGDKICDFEENNLHVIGYSTGVTGIVTWKELKEHIHTLIESYDAIPYVTSYYKERWGFCMTHRMYRELCTKYDDVDGIEFQVFIDADLKPGELIVADTIIPGKTSDEILLSTYLCHPSMANNELCGPLVWAMAYKRLKSMPEFNHTLRFYIGPENIGAVAYLSKFGACLKKYLDAGYIINCVGLGPEYTYKESRQDDSLADRAAWNVLRPKNHNRIEFFPDGSDERQFCSPGYNLPIGVFMRKGYWEYPEYHTSLDNKGLISFETMEESVNTIVDMVLTADRGTEIYKCSVRMGSPMFAKCKEDIYGSTMNLNNFYKGENHRRMVLELCNWSDGSNSLLNIAEKTGKRLLDYLPLVDRLVKLGYLEMVRRT